MESNAPTSPAVAGIGLTSASSSAPSDAAGLAQLLGVGDAQWPGTIIAKDMRDQREPECGWKRLAREIERRRVLTRSSSDGRWLATVAVSLDDPRMYLYEIADSGPSVEEVVAARFDARWIRALVASLPDDYERLVIGWRFGLNGARLSLSALAERLDLPRSTVYDLENRALESLRDAIGLRDEAVDHMRRRPRRRRTGADLPIM